MSFLLNISRTSLLVVCQIMGFNILSKAVLFFCPWIDTINKTFADFLKYYLQSKRSITMFLKLHKTVFNLLIEEQDFFVCHWPIPEILTLAPFKIICTSNGQLFVWFQSERRKERIRIFLRTIRHGYAKKDVLKIRKIIKLRSAKANKSFIRSFKLRSKIIWNKA